jgi:hypothetical protein
MLKLVVEVWTAVNEEKIVYQNRRTRSFVFWIRGGANFATAAQSWKRPARGSAKKFYFHKI